MGDRDSWCTPPFITRRLPLVDLDPCSNSRSTVKARRALSLERGENGLLISWRGLSVFVNGPFSNLLPFAQKAVEARSYCYLVNIDVSTSWYRELTQWETWEFKFRKRVGFRNPPGVEASQNNHSQVLLCDETFYEQIKDSFVGLGQWWKKL